MEVTDDSDDTLLAEAEVFTVTGEPREGSLDVTLSSVMLRVEPSLEAMLLLLLLTSDILMVDK